MLCFPGGTFVRYIRSILGAIPGFHSVRHWVDVRSHMAGRKKFQFYFGVLHLRLLGIVLLNNGGVTTDWEM